MATQVYYNYEAYSHSEHWYQFLSQRGLILYNFLPLFHLTLSIPEHWPLRIDLQQPNSDQRAIAVIMGMTQTCRNLLTSLSSVSATLKKPLIGVFVPESAHTNSLVPYPVSVLAGVLALKWSDKGKTRKFYCHTNLMKGIIMGKHPVCSQPMTPCWILPQIQGLWPGFAKKVSGAWLNALSISALGLRYC